MGSFKSHSLKKNILQVVTIVCVVFACRAPGRLQNGPSDSLDVLWCSGGPWLSSSFFRHTSRFPEVLNPQQWIFGPVLGPEGEFGSEYGTHAAPLRWSDFAKSRFRRQMRAARWTTPSLRLRSVVTGTSQRPALFEPNRTLLRPHLPSQCPSESREDILPHAVLFIDILRTSITNKILNKFNSGLGILFLFFFLLLLNLVSFTQIKILMNN